MARIVDNLISNLEYAFKEVANRKKELSRQIVERDADKYKYIFRLLEAMQGHIANICREEVTLISRPATINSEKGTSKARFVLQQGEINYVKFDELIFDITLDGESITINDARFSTFAYEDAFSSIVQSVLRAMKVPSARADFGLPNDPIRMMAARQANSRRG